VPDPPRPSPLFFFFFFPFSSAARSSTRADRLNHGGDFFFFFSPFLEGLLLSFPFLEARTHVRGMRKWQIPTLFFLLPRRFFFFSFSFPPSASLEKITNWKLANKFEARTFFFPPPSFSSLACLPPLSFSFPLRRNGASAKRIWRLGMIVRTASATLSLLPSFLFLPTGSFPPFHRQEREGHADAPVLLSLYLRLFFFFPLCVSAARSMSSRQREKSRKAAPCLFFLSPPPF